MDHGVYYTESAVTVAGKLKFIFLFLFAFVILFIPGEVIAQVSCPQGSSLNIVAHQDDDLLFLSPDILGDIKSKRCLTTIYVTAGDANSGSVYWKSREDGVRAAYALMAGVSNSWRQTDAGIRNRPIPIYTLRSNSSIALIFLRLPDGNWDGTGFSNNNNESVKKLWQGNISSIKTVDGSSTYKKDDLVATLLTLMTNFRPDTIRTQNYIDGFSTSDHSDHTAAAYAALEAHKLYLRSHTFIGYIGYAISSRPANVAGADL